jgi:hypothetical protein
VQLYAATAVNNEHMRFEREKDIPAMQGKTRKEREALREKAIHQDPSLQKTRILGIILTMCFMPVTDWILNLFGSYSLVAWLALFMIIALPFALTFKGLFITPRVRQILAKESV